MISPDKQPKNHGAAAGRHGTRLALTVIGILITAATGGLAQEARKSVWTLSADDVAGVVVEAAAAFRFEYHRYSRNAPAAPPTPSPAPARPP